VNHRRNEQYFLRSDFLHVHSDEFWKENPEMGMRAQLFEFDGFTKLLKATLKLREGKTYHLKICIADVGDQIFDSGVMIRANSLASKGNRIEKADEIVKQYVSNELKKVKQDQISYNEGDLSFNVRIRFNTNESIILEDSRQELLTVTELLMKLQSLKLLIIGHTDDEGSEAGNMQLSINRALSVKQFLIDQGISSKRISTAGKGESSPLTDNESEAAKSENRRVEFQLSY
jgi:outer membrane protein OmpA-like peptidoglycan-associated protein